MTTAQETEMDVYDRWNFKTLYTCKPPHGSRELDLCYSLDLPTCFPDKDVFFDMSLFSWMDQSGHRPLYLTGSLALGDAYANLNGEVLHGNTNAVLSTHVREHSTLVLMKNITNCIEEIERKVYKQSNVQKKSLTETVEINNYIHGIECDILTYLQERADIKASTASVAVALPIGCTNHGHVDVFCSTYHNLTCALIRAMEKISKTITYVQIIKPPKALVELYMQSGMPMIHAARLYGTYIANNVANSQYTNPALRNMIYYN